MAVAPPVMAAVEALPAQGGEQQASNPQHLTQAMPTMLATPGPVPPSQPSTVLSLPAAMAVTPPVPASMANTVASPTQPAASSTAACAASSSCPDVKIKQEVETMDTSQPGRKRLLPPVIRESVRNVDSHASMLHPCRSQCEFVLSPGRLHPGQHAEPSGYSRAGARGLAQEEAPQTAARHLHRGERDGGNQQHR